MSCRYWEKRARTGISITKLISVEVHFGKLFPKHNQTTLQHTHHYYCKTGPNTSSLISRPSCCFLICWCLFWILFTILFNWIRNAPSIFLQMSHWKRNNVVLKLQIVLLLTDCEVKSQFESGLVICMCGMWASLNWLCLWYSADVSSCAMVVRVICCWTEWTLASE